MKIVAICGSPRKGNTYRVLETMKENFPEVDFNILMLKDLNFELCRGCYSCVMKGEEKCPIKDDRDMILKEMTEADGVIFSSPAYSHMVSALMKNFFDRFGYLAHRPQFFDKYSMSLTTGSGYGAEYAIQYMDKMATIFGFNVAPNLDLNVRPGKVKEDEKQFNEKKAKEAFTFFLARIQEGTKDKPTLNMMVPFGIFKAISVMAKDTMLADYEYYKDKQDFYYNVNIPFFKKWIANKIVKKEVDKILN